MVSDWNKDFGGSTDLGKKGHGSVDLHTPIHSLFKTSDHPVASSLIVKRSGSVRDIFLFNLVMNLMI